MWESFKEGFFSAAKNPPLIFCSILAGALVGGLIGIFAKHFC